MNEKEILRSSVRKKQKNADKNSNLPFNIKIKWPDKPSKQLFAGKRLIQALGLTESDLSEINEPYLAPPHKVYFNLGERRNPNCSQGNTITDSHKENKLSIPGIKKAVDKLAEIGVLQIAFDVGESFSTSELLEIADHVREKGIAVTVTTDGFFIDETIAKECRAFDRINIDVDSAAIGNSGSRDKEDLTSIDRAVFLLKNNKAAIGFNVEVSAENFTRLGEICNYSNSKEVGDVFLRRYKAITRGKGGCDELALKADHFKVLVPMTQRLTKRFGVKFQMDCSLFPALAFHSIDTEVLPDSKENGCSAGNSVMSIAPDGFMRACRFCYEKVGSVFDMNSVWQTSSHLSAFRSWRPAPADPCTFCRYLNVCNGGCRAAAYYETGSYNNPDPACPIVVDFKHGIIHPALSAV